MGPHGAHKLIRKENARTMGLMEGRGVRAPSHAPRPHTGWILRGLQGLWHQWALQHEKGTGLKVVHWGLDWGLDGGLDWGLDWSLRSDWDLGLGLDRDLRVRPDLQKNSNAPLHLQTNREHGTKIGQEYVLKGPGPSQCHLRTASTQKYPLPIPLKTGLKFDLKTEACGTRV